MITYRRDIDGLRALAVLMVVVCHAGQGWLPGGFVGVDVFFVISGFLISAIVLEQARQGRFSLAGFYDRRIRRIVPAYGVVAAAATLAAIWLLPPGELAAFGRRLKSSAAFLANFQFRSEASYFAPVSADNPLLHLWSLSVEEQFYLVWPLALAGFMRVTGGRGLMIGLAALAAASLAGSVLMVRGNPAGAFYFTPVRAWELLLGALVAAGAGPSLRQRPALRQASALLGLAGLALPALSYTATAPAFPGWAALPPCLGAVLLLHAGSQGPTWAGRLLATRPLVAVGKLSYSLYLWHWPLFCFARLWLLRPLHPLEALGLIAASLALAALSWRWVEEGPRRGRGAIAGVPGSFVWGGLTLATLALIGLGLTAIRGLPGRASSSALSAAAHVEAHDPEKAGCLIELRGQRASKPCVMGDRVRDPGGSVMVIGDSHADALAPGLADAARSLGLSIRERARTSCSPAEANVVLASDARADCDAFKHRALREALDDPAVRTVVLAGRWNTLAAATRASGGLHPALAPWVGRLRRAGRRVVLVAQVPEFATGGGRCMVRARFMGRSEALCFTARAAHDRYAQPALAALARFAAADPGVVLVDPTSVYCDRQWCRPEIGGRVVYSDVHHLTPDGARALAPRLREALEPAARR